nr:reverse transcriptase domain-containing protein [Tanacetum cinerariifolium]
MMVDQRTMAQLLQAPTEGYEVAIVVPTITTDNFELKHGLLTLVKNKKFLDMKKKTCMLTFDISTRSLLLEVPKRSEYPRWDYEPEKLLCCLASLTEFELKKILLDKMQKSKSYRGAKEHNKLYDGLVKSYKFDKDLFESYGKAYSLKRNHEYKDKDEDPPAGSNQRLKRRKTNEDVEPSKGSKSKESKSSSSKGNKSQPKSSDFRPPQTWIIRIAQAEKPPLTFDELMSSPIDFSAYVINHLKIDKLTQKHLVGPTFNLLKGTCKIRVELEYNSEECYKALTNRLD